MGHTRVKIYTLNSNYYWLHSHCSISNFIKQAFISIFSIYYLYLYDQVLQDNSLSQLFYPPTKVRAYWIYKKDPC